MQWWGMSAPWPPVYSAVPPGKICEILQDVAFWRRCVVLFNVVLCHTISSRCPEHQTNKLSSWTLKFNMIVRQRIWGDDVVGPIGLISAFPRFIRECKSERLLLTSRSVYICQSCRKNESGVVFLAHSVRYCGSCIAEMYSFYLVLNFTVSFFFVMYDYHSINVNNIFMISYKPAKHKL